MKRTAAAALSTTPQLGPEFIANDNFSVARAIRATADRDGADFVRALHRAYGEFNDLYFGGELPPAAILVTRTQSPRALGDHISIDENGIRFRVRISPVTCKVGIRFALDTLLHEMVHIAQVHLDGDGEPGYQGHGPKFARRCNEIGAKLGLPEVFPRGARRGKPDCAHWPVRPDDFYGDKKLVRGKTKRSKSGSREDGEGDGEGERESRKSVLERAVRRAIEFLQDGSPEDALAVLRSAVE